MRLGVMLPTFSHSARGALDAARRADDEGLHGVFAYDHLWPLGEPGRPALPPLPLLAAASELTSRIRLGTLVSRIGLAPDELLLEELLTLDALSAGRLVAGLGTGDRKSADENQAYGVPMSPVAERQVSLGVVVGALVARGVEVWVGAGLGSTNAVARRTGATLNLWGAPPEAVAAAAAEGPVSWAGAWPRSQAVAAHLLEQLAAAGATWAVFGWPGTLQPLLEAAGTAGLALGA